jgi:hypothetical protein
LIFGNLSFTNATQRSFVAQAFTITAAASNAEREYWLGALLLGTNEKEKEHVHMLPKKEKKVVEQYKKTRKHWGGGGGYLAKLVMLAFLLAASSVTGVDGGGGINCALSLFSPFGGASYASGFDSIIWAPSVLYKSVKKKSLRNVKKKIEKRNKK